MRIEQSRLSNSSAEAFIVNDSRIEESHCRSYALGVRKDTDRITNSLKQDKLNSLLYTHAGLIHHAKLLFSEALHTACDNRVLFMLTDARAHILALNSKLSNLNIFMQKGMCLGASLSETSIGTNSVSLALHDLENSVVGGLQHYCRLFYDCYCVAVPILGSDGRLIGCLNLSTIDGGSMDIKLTLMNFIAKDLVDYCIRHTVIDIDPTQSKVKLAVGTEIRLTERQKVVLILFSQGLSYKQIAKNLQLRSEKTVEEHLDAVRTKLGARNRRDCIRKALEKNLL